MRIGLVTKWFNRGQAFVSRYLRDALDAQGHETFILARPTKDKGPMASDTKSTGKAKGKAKAKKSKAKSKAKAKAKTDDMPK